MTTAFEDAVEAAQTFFRSSRIDKHWIWKICKERKYVEPRQFVCAFMRARDPNKYSYPLIANAIKRKDHTTVIVAIRQAHKRWGQSLFMKLAAVSVVGSEDQDTFEQPVHISVTEDELLAIGEINLSRFVNGKGWEVAA